MKAMLSRGVWPFRFDGNASVTLATGSVSPVKLDSSIDKSYACQRHHEYVNQQAENKVCLFV